MTFAYLRLKNLLCWGKKKTKKNWQNYFKRAINAKNWITENQEIQIVKWTWRRLRQLF